MPLSKIAANGITNINSTQIAGGLNSIALDIASGTGNGAASIPIGTTAQRPANPNIGYLRYNTTTQSMENYTANGWFKISVQTPAITSISGTIYNGLVSTLTITGQNFGTSNASVNFLGANTASVTGLTPVGTISVTVPSAIYTIATGSSVSVTVTNSDGLTSAGYIMTVVGLPTGGTISTSGNTLIHTFTTSGDFIVPSTFASTTASYLIVGGGAGSGWGGGGAGGLRSGTSTISPNQTYSVVVGSGGAAGVPGTPGNSGGSSSVFSVPSSGGGYGSSGSTAGGSGGSGGGGGQYTAPGGSGTPGQGNPGGNGAQNQYDAGGGGGGAGASGGNGTGGPAPMGYSIGGAGGNGLSSSITGSPVYYAGGGSGGSQGVPASPIPGGQGGGGRGATPSVPGLAGTTNTGGGAGGVEKAGGSGVVIISYPMPS